MGISAGAIVEVRLMLGSTIIFNAAFLNLPGGTAPVAILGLLRNYTGLPGVTGEVPMVRLTYTLFETSGT